MCTHLSLATVDTDDCTIYMRMLYEKCFLEIFSDIWNHSNVFFLIIRKEVKYFKVFCRSSLHGIFGSIDITEWKKKKITVLLTCSKPCSDLQLKFRIIINFSEVRFHFVPIRTKIMFIVKSKEKSVEFGVNNIGV